MAVYKAQSLLLATTTALFLCSSFLFGSGGALKRLTVSTALALFLLSPLVIVWPSGIFFEGLAVPILLMFLAGCIALDGSATHAPVFVGLTSGVVVWVRDPLIPFVCLFVTLLVANCVSARAKKMRLKSIGLPLLLAVLSFGIAREIIISLGCRSCDQVITKYISPLSNIVQLRILPNSERTTFFVAHGMPATPTVMDRAEKPAEYKGILDLPDNEVSTDFVAYRNWLKTRGFNTYFAFLLTHPEYIARSIAISPNYGLTEYAQDVHFSLLDLFSVPRDKGYWTELSPYPQGVSDFLLAPMGWVISFLYFGYLVVVYVIRTVRRQEVPSMEIVALAAFPSIFATYHADALDLWRHSAPLLVAIYVSFLWRIPELIAYATTRLRVPVFRNGLDNRRWV